MTITGGTNEDDNFYDDDDNEEDVSKVIRYTVVNGYYHILPSLKTGRRDHACGHFTNSDGAIVS